MIFCSSAISAAIGFKRMARQFGVFLQPDETNSGKDNEPKFIIEPEAYNRIMSPTKTFTDEAKLQIAGVVCSLCVGHFGIFIEHVSLI